MFGMRALRRTPELAWGPGTVALRLPAEHGLVAGAADPSKRETWIQISKSGSWAGHSSGPFQLTREHFESAIAEQAKLRTPLNFDYEHASASCIPVHAPSSGYASKLEIRGEAGEETLWAYTRLTKKAVQEVLDEEYRHISPTWMFDHPDRELGEESPVLASLHSVALTNTPFLDGMEPITLSATMSRLANIGRFANVALAGKGQMDNEQPGTKPKPEGAPPEEGAEDTKRIEHLMQVLGLADRAALDAWAEEQGKPKEPKGGEGQPPAEAALKLSMAAHDRDRAELERLRAAEADREVTALIASGRALEGERTELLELRSASPAMFKKLSERAPIVPMGRDSRVKPGPSGPNASVTPQSPAEEVAVRNLRAAGFTDAEINAALEAERTKETTR